MGDLGGGDEHFGEVDYGCELIFKVVCLEHLKGDYAFGFDRDCLLFGCPLSVPLMKEIADLLHADTSDGSLTFEIVKQPLLMFVVCTLLDFCL